MQEEEETQLAIEAAKLQAMKLKQKESQDLIPVEDLTRKIDNTPEGSDMLGDGAMKSSGSGSLDADSIFH